MNVRTEKFQVGEEVLVDALTYSGDITLSEGPRGVVEVQLAGGKPDAYRVEQRGRVVSVTPESDRGFARRFSSTNIQLSVPQGTSAKLKCGSGDIVVSATLVDLAATVASGDIRISTVTGDVTLKSASGDIRAGEIGGDLRVSTASGDVHLGRSMADVTVNSASGDVVADYVGGVPPLRSASGDVKVDELAGSAIESKTLSGDVRIGIPPGRIVDLDLQSLSGELKNELSEAASSQTAQRSLAIRVKTVSGNLHLYAS